MQALNFLEQLERFKAELIDEVSRQAAWHARKAVDKPMDPCLRIGADVLSAVARELEDIPADHPAMREAWRRWYGLQGEERSSHEKLFRAMILQEFYINYGFKWESSGAERFLERYVDALDTAREVTPRHCGS